MQALLRKAPPRIRGRAAGAPIADESGDLVRQSIEAIAGLDESDLFVQGPPGAGKTFTGSHVIAELLRRGKRIAVSSNSHKAINNLLAALEKVAKERRSISGA